MICGSANAPQRPRPPHLNLARSIVGNGRTMKGGAQPGQRRSLPGIAPAAADSASVPVACLVTISLEANAGRGSVGPCAPHCSRPRRRTRELGATLTATGTYFARGIELGAFGNLTDRRSICGGLVVIDTEVTKSSEVPARSAARLRFASLWPGLRVEPRSPRARPGRRGRGRIRPRRAPRERGRRAAACAATPPARCASTGPPAPTPCAARRP
jgi:hypothetical protein